MEISIPVPPTVLCGDFCDKCNTVSLRYWATAVFAWVAPGFCASLSGVDISRSRQSWESQDSPGDWERERVFPFCGRCPVLACCSPPPLPPPPPHDPASSSWVWTVAPTRVYYLELVLVPLHSCSQAS